MKWIKQIGRKSLCHTGSLKNKSVASHLYFEINSYSVGKLKMLTKIRTIQIKFWKDNHYVH